MAQYLFFTSIVNYRIPLDDQGNPGHPEILSKFTSEPKTQKAPTKATKKAQGPITAPQGDVEYAD
jgi:hypothetical protein